MEGPKWPLIWLTYWSPLAWFRGQFLMITAKFGYFSLFSAYKTHGKWKMKLAFWGWGSQKQYLPCHGTDIDLWMTLSHLSKLLLFINNFLTKKRSIKNVDWFKRYDEKRFLISFEINIDLIGRYLKNSADIFHCKYLFYCDKVPRVFSSKYVFEYLNLSLMR